MASALFDGLGEGLLELLHVEELVAVVGLHLPAESFGRCLDPLRRIFVVDQLQQFAKGGRPGEERGGDLGPGQGGVADQLSPFDRPFAQLLPLDRPVDALFHAL
jgi:hypothetical protein